MHHVQAGDFGPLKLFALLAFVGTYPKGWLADCGSGSSSGSGSRRRAQPSRRAKSKDEEDDEDWGMDGKPAEREGEGEEDDVEELVAKEGDGEGGVKWQEP